ncbi:hypothetical protein LWV33_03220 [Brucella intermedia]
MKALNASNFDTGANRTVGKLLDKSFHFGVIFQGNQSLVVINDPGRDESAKADLCPSATSLRICGLCGLFTLGSFCL